MRLAVGDRLHGVADERQFDLPADHTGTGADGQASGEGDRRARTSATQGLPEHLDTFDWVGQALQGPCPEAPVPMAATASGREPNDVGGKDLSTVAESA